MCSLHYGFVWIAEPIVGASFVQLCMKTVLSAYYHILIGLERIYGERQVI